MYIPSRERIRIRAAEARRMREAKERLEQGILPPVIRCLVCKKPMPPGWTRKDSFDGDTVCDECRARPVRQLTGWGGYAGHCPDVSGGDSGWDIIVRRMEDAE